MIFQTKIPSETSIVNSDFWNCFDFGKPLNWHTLERKLANSVVVKVSTDYFVLCAFVA